MNKKERVNIVWLSISIFFIFILMVFPTYNIKYSIETNVLDLRLYSQNYIFHEIDFCSKLVCFDFNIGELE